MASIPPLSAVNSARRGAAREVARVNEAAHAISAWGLEAGEPVDEISAVAAARAVHSAESGEVPAEGARSGDESADLIDATVQQITAVRGYTASLKVIRAADQMTGQLIDLLA